jgi:hypothetical protein
VSIHRDIAARMPGEWTAVTFTNSWVDFGAGYQAVQYRKVGDMVELRGTMKNGTLGATAFTLPAGHLPPAYIPFTCPNSAGTHIVAYVTVDATGQVAVSNFGGVTNADISLNGVSFSTIA